MPRPIEHRAHLDADPATVHDLLVDVAAWPAWSPHVASSEPSSGRCEGGMTIRTRAFFSPAVTPMHVDWVREGEGMGWHSRALGHTLRYEDRVAPAPGGGTDVHFVARLEGPAAGLLTAVARPLSALGMRRRVARLGRVAQVVDARTAGPAGGRPR
jgi:hypothetical protein